MSASKIYFQKDSANKPYAMQDVVEAVLDPDSFFEQKVEFAPNILTGFARLGGRSVGVVANNPAHMAGFLDIDASTKAARFVPRFCDAFSLPIVTFVDYFLDFSEGARAWWNHPTWSKASLRLLRGYVRWQLLLKRPMVGLTML